MVKRMPEMPLILTIPKLHGEEKLIMTFLISFMMLSLIIHLFKMCIVLKK